MIPRVRLWLLLRIGAVIAALIILFFSGLLPVEEWLSALPQGLSASVAASDVASLTNEQRIENGLAPLSVSPLLNEAASLKARDMAQYSYYAHTGPDGKTPLSWLSQVGYRYLNAGENLVIDRTSASQAVDSWMNSPEHRENILRPQFTEIGVGVAEGEYEGVPTIFVVEEFGTPYPTYTAAKLRASAAPVAPVVTQAKPPVLTTTVPVTPSPAAPAIAAAPAANVAVAAAPQKQAAAAPAPTPTAKKPISIPKIATLATIASSAVESHTPAAISTQTTTTAGQGNVAAASTSASTTIVYTLAPEFYKPVRVPRTEQVPAAPEGSSATRVSVWIAGISSFIQHIFGL